MFTYNFSYYSPLILFIFVALVLMSHLSFLIVVMSPVFFFFFLVNPAKDLSRQFIFDLESLSWFNIQSACDVLEM